MLAAICAGLHRHAERLLHAVGLRLLHPALAGLVRPGRHVSRDGLCRRPAGTLRRPDVRGARAHRDLGQGAPAVQRRRPVRPCGHRHDAPRRQAHVGRSARQLAVHARRLASAGASGHRHGAGHGHAEHHHLRRPVRPRLRGEMVLRLRRARRARGDHAGGEGRRDHGRWRIICEASRAYANAKPASIAWGLAIDQKPTASRPPTACWRSWPSRATSMCRAASSWRENDGLELGIGWGNLGPELPSKTLGIKEYPLYVDNVRNAQSDMMFDARRQATSRIGSSRWAASKTRFWPPPAPRSPWLVRRHGKNLELCMASTCA